MFACLSSSAAGWPQLAVRTLNLGIERGECFGLLGPNGAGKSTSINMMVSMGEGGKGRQASLMPSSGRSNSRNSSQQW
jgi:ABC-type multidrug transport system ATPase subunit